MNSCPWFDEYNGQCMWERMERIERVKKQKPNQEQKTSSNDVKECLKEMP